MMSEHEEILRLREKQHNLSNDMVKFTGELDGIKKTIADKPNHAEIIPAHEEKFCNMERRVEHVEEGYEKVIKIGERLARIEEVISNAVNEIGNHIRAGSKYRLAIFCSSLGLVSLFITGVVRFAVIDYKVSILEKEGVTTRGQIYDLNYEKGRAVGLQEAKEKPEITK